MAHSLHKLLAGITNTPQLITASAMKPIVEYLQLRNSPNFILDAANVAEIVKEEPEMVGGIGEIKVDGAISYQPVMGMCGPQGTSYSGILEQAEELIESGVDTILMTFSSPGGAAAHCFSTCEELRSMCDDAGVSLISYVDEQAASAALALSVVSDEVIIHPSATTGSVGCVCCIYDVSKAMEMEGIKPIYIASTPGKTPFEDDGSFSADFMSDLQEDVISLGNQFAQHVSKYTGLNVDDILAMDAKMFNADKALEVGLVTAVMDHKQFSAYMADKQGAKNAKAS